MTMSKPAAVIFDFDGTLADSYAAISASVNHVRASHGLAPLSEEDVKRHVGRGPIYLLEHTVPGTNVEQDLALYRAHHPSVMYQMTRLLPGGREALAGLHAQGKKLGVCSNKPRIFTTELLRHLGIERYLSLVLGPDDVARPKPAPDMLTLALARLGTTPAQALYVGDMVVDITTARAANVPVWVVPTGSDDRATLQRAKPDRLVDDLVQLAALLV